MTTFRVGINGLGRTGRLVLREIMRSGAQGNDTASGTAASPRLEVVAINDIAPPEALVYLLDHDGVHRRRPGAHHLEHGTLVSGSMRARLTAEVDPFGIGWHREAIDLVFECSGRFTTREGLARHLAHPAGPRYVLLADPGVADRTLVRGVNDEMLRPADDRTVSAASSATHALAPVLAVLSRAFGLRWAMFQTVQAYGADQALTDRAHPDDLRRGRAAASNLVPTATDAVRALNLVLPDLAGKLEGTSLRVPIAQGALYELVCTLEGAPGLERVMEALTDAARSPALSGILDVRDEPLVSTDILEDTHSSVVDVGASRAVGPLMKIVGWYDPEVAYAKRLVELAVRLAAARSRA